MTVDRYHFDDFTLDPADRTLRRGAVPVEISARYFDALLLLVGDAGKLVTKDRFMEEVWRGVPVTDEALTQCVRMLRRQLGDNAGRPRFIETVPKHGYRFMASVSRATSSEVFDEDATLPKRVGTGRYTLREFFVTGGAGTLGAAVAGVVGGLFYGSVGASAALGPGTSGLSVLLVLLWLTIVAAMVGGAGVSFGIAAAGFVRGRAWRIVGGAMGGLIVGGLVKLLGLDAFNLLLGRSPGDITGAPEGLLLGGAVGVGSWLSAWRGRDASVPAGSAVPAIAGSIGAIAVLLLGGKLMGGSLDLLVEAFPDSRLRVDHIGLVFGEGGFGTITQFATAAFEGALFGGCIVGSMGLAKAMFQTDSESIFADNAVRQPRFNADAHK